MAILLGVTWDEIIAWRKQYATWHDCATGRRLSGLVGHSWESTSTGESPQ